MKLSLLLIALLISCAKESSKKNSPASKPVNRPNPIVEVVDPLSPGDQQQQSDGEFTLRQTYNGVNVVLNYGSRQNLGMIRIKDKDAKKLYKYMALKKILVQSPHVKNDLEAKVGRNIHCREEICWLYIDYKNGDVLENKIQSEPAKAPKIILPYRGINLELHMTKRKGRIFFEGMDAKALYSVMAIPEVEKSSKGGSLTKKTGDGVECSRLTKDTLNSKSVYRCEVNFNHRLGSLTND